MKHICITGVSGYLGMRLVNTLSARDDVETILGIDIVPPRVLSSKLTFVKMDIRSGDLKTCLSDHHIDTVCHLAFVVKPIHDLKKMHDIDYNGTRNVLKSAFEVQSEYVVAISSTLAYGAHEDNPLALFETHPLRGNERYPYGYYKRQVDTMIQDFASANPEMPITILRPCTVFGPSVDNYVSRMLFLPVTVSVKGFNPAVQLVHENDFVDACILALDKRIPGIFNIAGDGILTAEEIARIIGTKLIPIPAFVLYPLLELLWRIRAPGVEVNSGYLDYARYPFIASNTKAKEELGFAPKHTSKETLLETVRHRK
ncbi:MAG: NAD-dependent epimerase/dehydratase family protein [Proteobacteria bacterium]|nr:NAD-dependent epimerase/dehydratase family protein [Pseudomonadota bacterium]